METDVTVQNECSLERIGSDHVPIVHAASGTYQRYFEKLLLSVRVLGSAARGDAIWGASDINFVGLVSMNPEAHQRERLAAEATRLTRTFQSVSTVELEIEIKGRVSPLRQFTFRADSLCVWGADEYSGSETRMPNRALADLTSPDFGRLLAGYRQRLRAAPDGEALAQCGRSIGKDVLRSFPGSISSCARACIEAAHATFTINW